MDKILFITNRNVINTCGELRLIKNRIISLKEEFNISTDIIAIRNKKRIGEVQENIGVSSTLDLIKYSSDLFINNSYIKKQIYNKIVNNNYKCIILSGILVIKYVKFIKHKFPNIKVIVDIHGAQEELKEFKALKFTKKIRNKLLYIYSKHNEKKYINEFNGAFVVSSSLKEYIIKEYKAINLKYFIIPCGKTIINNDINKILDDRKNARKKYNVMDDEIVFIYSGGLSPWQCIDESIQMFRLIKNNSDKKMKMFIFTNKKYVVNDDEKDIFVDNLHANDVEKTICMGDYAFLLRHDLITNNVAFPNKFLEYVNTGLKVISYPFMKDIVNYISKYNLGLILNSIDDIKEFKNLSNDFGNDFTKRIELLQVTSFNQTLIPFVKYIGDRNE